MEDAIESAIERALEKHLTDALKIFYRNEKAKREKKPRSPSGALAVFRDVSGKCVRFTTGESSLLPSEGKYAPRRLGFSLRRGKARIKENMMYYERTKFPSLKRRAGGSVVSALFFKGSFKRGFRECFACVRRRGGSVYGNYEINGGREIEAVDLVWDLLLWGSNGIRRSLPSKRNPKQFRRTRIIRCLHFAPRFVPAHNGASKHDATCGLTGLVAAAGACFNKLRKRHTVLPSPCFVFPNVKENGYRNGMRGIAMTFTEFVQ